MSRQECNHLYSLQYKTLKMTSSDLYTSAYTLFEGGLYECKELVEEIEKVVPRSSVQNVFGESLRKDHILFGLWLLMHLGDYIDPSNVHIDLEKVHKVLDLSLDVVVNFFHVFYDAHLVIEVLKRIGVKSIIINTPLINETKDALSRSLSTLTSITWTLYRENEELDVVCDIVKEFESVSTIRISNSLSTRCDVTPLIEVIISTGRHFDTIDINGTFTGVDSVGLLLEKDVVSNLHLMVNESVDTPMLVEKFRCTSNLNNLVVCGSNGDGISYCKSGTEKSSWTFNPINGKELVKVYM